jgi:hypothetical protein
VTLPAHRAMLMKYHLGKYFLFALIVSLNLAYPLTHILNLTNSINSSFIPLVYIFSSLLPLSLCLLTIGIILPFLEFHEVKIIEYASFSDFFYLKM